MFMRRQSSARHGCGTMSVTAMGRRLQIITGVLAVVVVILSCAQDPRALQAARDPRPVFIAEGQARSGYQPSDRQLAQWALDAWSRSAGGDFAWRSSAENDALIRV